jgi:signal transduction histidine kinase
MVESLERAAMQLGTSIRHVWAESDLRRAYEGLEVQVQARTAQLSEAKRKLEEEMGQRNRLEREILHVATDEQQRIGQELHDGIGQELTGLGYLASRLYNRLRERNSPEVASAAELARGLPQTVTQIQAIVKGLLPLELGAEDLTPALQDLLAGTEERTGIVCGLEGQVGPFLRDKQSAVQLYRIAQEAVNNAVKHGGPTKVVLTLRDEPDRLVLEVRDDGQGTCPGGERAVGSGLRIMNYRARAIGGVLETELLASGGSLVRCVLPRESNHGD